MNLSSLASVAATLLSLVLSIWLFIANNSAQALQSELQKQQQSLQNQQQLVQTQQQTLQGQQEQIQSGNVLAQQVGPQVLQDLARRAVTNKNEKIRGLLSKYNLNIEEKKDDKKPDDKKPAPAPANP